MHSHWVPVHPGIPGNEETERQVNVACDAGGDTRIERPYTLASNMARWISEARTASKARWEADRCSKHIT